MKKLTLMILLLCAACSDQSAIHDTTEIRASAFLYDPEAPPAPKGAFVFDPNAPVLRASSFLSQQ